ncbi:unnamed protein product [Rotaria magnacalcarata]|uniref:EF-hand domain-containing protein n=1 Tax=Rotaria magnacalcarata TaxID=392030 RepID=A0A8S2PCP7_9BILA|nr:unnamed protein product [Rotaria magnacalcarata]
MRSKNDTIPTSYANPAFDDEPTGGKLSSGPSPIGSNVFIVKQDHGNRNRLHAEPFRLEPVTRQSIGRSIIRGVRSLWATRQTEKDLGKNKDLYVKTTLRELFIYLVFIVILCIITFGMTSTKTFYFTTGLRTIFTTQQASGAGSQPAFDDIASFEDFWTVLKDPIFNGLYTEKWYNGYNLTQDQYGYVLFENKILGLPRLRQLRVTNDSCTVHKKFQKTIEECYASYSTSKEDHSSYGTPDTNLTKDAWYYQTSAQLHGSSSSGLISRYGGGGFVHDMSITRDEAKAELQNLYDNLWLDRGTRVVFLDFTVYNANINLFCQIKLTVEFPASGGAVASKSFATVKLIRRYVYDCIFGLCTTWLFIICFTLFRIILGDFNFDAILEAHRILGPIFFLTYVFFVFFVLLNMFLAIINDTYSEVKSDLSTQKSEFELGDFFKRSYEKMLERLNVKRDRIIDIQDALKNADVNKDGVIEFGEWRRDLKARGYTDVEIENVFSRYDIDGDRILRDAEQLHFKADLTALENNLETDINNLRKESNASKPANGLGAGESDNGNRVTYDEFAILVRRIDRMEYSIGNIVSRIDDVLTKLEVLEKSKIKRREALTRILNNISEDTHLSRDDRHERLEKMIRNELEGNSSERQTPIQSLLTDTPDTHATSYYQSQTSLRQGQDEKDRSRPSTGKKKDQY